MSVKTLREAENSVQDFLNEAKFCAENEKGFAAMCTVFPVMLAVSEALNPSEKSNPQLIQKFIEYMRDKRTWLSSTKETSITDEVLTEQLNQLRNGLAHALSHSSDVILVNKISEIESYPELPSDKWFISVTEFIEAVSTTVRYLIEHDKPSHKFDPNPKGGVSRSPSEGGDAPWGSSASGIDVGKDGEKWDHLIYGRSLLPHNKIEQK